MPRPNDPRHRPPAPPPSHDQFLIFLASLIERSGARLGITLQFDGVVVSGIWIDTKTYLTETGERFGAVVDEAEGVAPEDRGAIAANMQEWGESEGRRLRDATNTEFFFIHLKDATIHGAANFNFGEGILWRGRIDRVAGFVLAPTNLPA